MKAFAVKDAKSLCVILDTFAQLDDIRWSRSENYNLINYCSADLSPDERLLTHWLCYITDRQMPFQRIWDVGGYVVSHLVRSYSRQETQSVQELLNSYIRRDGEQISLECPMDAANGRLDQYGITGPLVPFASRYMPDDLVRICRTLEVLASTSGRSFARFIAASFRHEDDHYHAIRRTATALNHLTYVGGCYSEKDFEKGLKAVAEEVTVFEMPTRSQSDLFKRKRLWCSLRDYLKSPEFNNEFVAALGKAGLKNPQRWIRTNLELRNGLQALELPGDVWNNASVFREGLFSPFLANERRAWDMPRTVREVHNILAKDDSLRFYPEQLDVSFDFVPKMCVAKMCDVCIFSAGIKMTCHRQETILCPVVLVACGYRHICSPETCRLKENIAANLCRRAVATGDEQDKRG
ncbi:MAG: hypothetical protein ABSG68_12050 [Thermoguttaceae bacterium]|jgi:hypothetical protein